MTDWISNHPFVWSGITTTVGFIGGVVIAVATKVGSDWITDWRRARKAEQEALADLAELERHMPKIIETFRENLRKHPMNRRAKIHDSLFDHQSNKLTEASFYSPIHTGIVSDFVTLKEKNLVSVHVETIGYTIFNIKDSFAKLLIKTDTLTETPVRKNYFFGK